MFGGSRRNSAASKPGGEGSVTMYQPLAVGDALGGGAPSAIGPLEPVRSRGSCCCINTQGRAFNFVVGVVIMFSAALLCLEADLGKLGIGSGPDVHPESLSEDLQFAGLTATDRAALHNELQEGFKEDAWLKKKATDLLDKKLGKGKVPDLQAGASPKEAYTVCEYFVVLFFFMEMLIRFCDRCGDYCADPWFGLDFLVVLQGAMDLSLPFLAGTYASFKASGQSIPAVVEMPNWSWVLSLCRLMRVFRVLRVLRLSPRLRFLARDFARAATAVMWVGIAILLTNFVCSILITSLIGQRAYQWGDNADRIDEWFGSVSRAMHTLFSVMTLSGWTEIDEVVSEVIPPVAVSMFFTLYLGACFFASISLVTGLIGETFLKTHLDSKEKKRQQVEEQRLALNIALEDLLACDAETQGFLSREGFTTVLNTNLVIFDRLFKLGIRTSPEELLERFDRLLLESEQRQAGLVRVEVLAEAMVTMRSDAKAEQILDLKLFVRSLRREIEEQAAKAHKEAAERHQKVLSHTLQEQQRSTTELKEQVATLQNSLASLHEGLTSVSTSLNGLSAIKQQLDERDRREEIEKAEKRNAFATVHQKLDAMTGKLAVQLSELSTHMVQVEVKVDSAVMDIADVSTRLSESVNATREGTLMDVGAIENSADAAGGSDYMAGVADALSIADAKDESMEAAAAVKVCAPPTAVTATQDGEAAKPTQNAAVTAQITGVKADEAGEAAVQPNPTACFACWGARSSSVRERRRNEFRKPPMSS